MDFASHKSCRIEPQWFSCSFTSGPKSFTQSRYDYTKRTHITPDNMSEWRPPFQFWHSLLLIQRRWISMCCVLIYWNHIKIEHGRYGITMQLSIVIMSSVSRLPYAPVTRVSPNTHTFIVRITVICCSIACWFSIRVAGAVSTASENGSATRSISLSRMTSFQLKKTKIYR